MEDHLAELSELIGFLVDPKPEVEPSNIFTGNIPLSSYIFFLKNLKVRQIALQHVRTFTATEEGRGVLKRVQAPVLQNIVRLLGDISVTLPPPQLLNR